MVHEAQGHTGDFLYLYLTFSTQKPLARLVGALAIESEFSKRVD